MTTRAFDQDTGFGSSTAPTAENAVASTDTPTFGQVALKASWYDHVDNIAAVKAIGASARVDGQVVAIDGQILYQFDSDSAAVADDDLILQPSVGTGRWHKVTSGGSAGVSGMSVEMIEQACELKHAGINVPPFDISVCEAFEGNAPTVEGFLLDAATASSSALVVVPNPLFLRTANKNTDFNAGEFAAVTGTDAANIDTETTTKKIGASAVSWDKAAGTSVNSFIQDDIGTTLNFSLSANRLVMCYINMPSVTNLSTISIRMSAEADDPTNYEQYNASTQWDGTAFATGWNLVAWDLDGASTTVGTGWAPESNLLRTFAVGVVASSAAQTYTNIVLDSLVFVPDAGEIVPTWKSFFQVGMAYTLADTSNREQIIISSASARTIGNITLASALANSYGGGSASVLMRSQLGWTGENNRTNFQSTSPFLGATLSSGTSNLTQDVRVSRILNETLTNATIATTACLDTELFFTVIDTPTSTTVTVQDLVNQSAQLLDTHTMHVIAVFENNGKKHYQHTTDITLTANSSWLSNVLTITASSGHITAIDNAIAAGGSAMLVKAGQLSVFLSSVGASSNESFSALTLEELNVVDVGLPYPKPSSVYGHYFKLTGTENTATFAALKRKGTGQNLTVVAAGASGFARTFKNGQFGAGQFSDTNYFSVGTLVSDSYPLDPDTGQAGLVSASLWFYALATPAGVEQFITRHDGANGWYFFYDTSRRLNLGFVGGSGTVATGAALALGTWNHFAAVMQDGGSSAIWVNGVKTSASGNTIVSPASGPLVIGRTTSAGGTALASGYLADIIFWSNAALSDADVAALYAGGRHRKLGANGGFTYRFESTALSGQKLSVRAELTRTTNAVEPFLTRLAAIKTN